ncbi:three-Cys-motif partner protein TcmP [Candidatus Acetothermia bacterium]|nr:three-Cys-motif partner protein TcmP [Candidatus Acetothermia bacterium]MBI3461240.1 three-Cys-motif partner protein TcmP [Candidatus Acetothermia bacterium]
MTDKFGGEWTELKLKILKDYLIPYSKIFDKNPKAQKLNTIYVDAFAGSGHRLLSHPKTNAAPSLFSDDTEADDKEFTEYLKGSAQIALEVEPGFQQYLFIEQSKSKVKELEKFKNNFKSKENRITIIQGDANACLDKFCAETNWDNHRAVVFLDPYGMQVEWSVIEKLGQTEAIDLWWLFPFGMGVVRLLTKDKNPPKEWEDALTRIFGTDEWRKAFYSQTKDLTLFGDKEKSKRDADFNSISKFVLKRLKIAFHAVAKNSKILRNSKNAPMYLLCFAVGNPRAAKTAINIAEDILGR